MYRLKVEKLKDELEHIARSIDIKGELDNHINLISNLLTNLKVRHKVNKNFIKTNRLTVRIPKISKDIAYLLGVLIGDGSAIMSKRKKGGFYYILQITSGSKKYLKYLNNLFVRLFDYKGQILRDKRKKQTFNLRVRSAVIFCYFIALELGIGKKQVIKTPEIVKNNKKLFLHFLAGLVDTDGCIYSRRIQLKQKDKKFLEEITKILLKLKLKPNPPKVNYTDSKPFYYIRFDNKLSLRYALVAQW